MMYMFALSIRSRYIRSCILTSSVYAMITIHLISKCEIVALNIGLMILLVIIYNHELTSGQCGPIWPGAPKPDLIVPIPISRLHLGEHLYGGIRMPVPLATCLAYSFVWSSLNIQAKFVRRAMISLCICIHKYMDIK